MELLKQTNTWEIVNSDPNYRNLSEDLRASETLSRIVAAEAAKKISEVSDSKTLIAKLRAWIRKFWNELKATFSQWTKKDISKLTLREFKAMPFRDLIEGVDPRKYQVEGGNALAASVDAAEVEAIKAERKNIEERAKADGTWLKAPNGQDTNLTPEQWVTVRTRRFKEWFGDWEKPLQIEKLRKSKAVSISGKEFEITDDFKQNKKNALKYSQSFTGEYTNADTGATIAIYRGRHNGGVNEVLQHNYKDIPHIQSIAAIPQIIGKSIYIESQPNNDIEKNPDVTEYQCYVCGLNIAGEDYTVLAKIAVDKKGNRYYDHNLTAVEKGKLIDIANNEQSAVASGFGTTPDTKSTTNSQRKYRELFSILQTNASKIVDANGEPKVVYNGSKLEHYNYDGRLRSKGQSATNSKVSFFTDRKDVAEKYGGFVNAVFLNIRNPYEVDYDGAGWQGWSGAKDGKQRMSTDSYADMLAGGTYNSTLQDMLKNYGRVEADHLVAGAARDSGKPIDGVVAYNVADPMVGNLYIVRNAEAKDISRERIDNKEAFIRRGLGTLLFDSQIKSVDNVGYFDPNNDDIRYTLGSEENSLVAIHNISGSKLAKALKQGGLANPSAAVIDIAKQSHEGYGEYSFILPKNLVAKKSGKNLGTYDRDAWTPLYPTVIYSHNKTSKANLNKLVEGLDEGLADKIKREVMMKVEGNGYYSGLQIVFLKDKGVEVPIATVTPRYAGTIEDLQSLFGDKEVTYDNYKALDQDAKNAVTIWIKARGNKADIERINGLMEQWSHNPKLIKSYTEEVGYGQFDNLLYGLQADARNSGNPDYGKTIENAVNYIRENNLQEEFDVWETAVISNLGFDEKIQVGWSPSGDRIMRKNTLENVSAYMRKQGKNASSDHWSNSEGKMLAKLAQNFATLEQIRANKHRLLSDVDSTMGIRRRMNQAAQIFMDFSKNSNLFLEEQSAYAYLEDILIGGMNPDKVVAEYNKATKRNISLTEEQKAELKELREDMNNIPVQYFETKFDRPVMFSEFAAVVAPNNMPEVIENQLREAGLNIYKYDPDVEGDRREQTLKATASDSIRFMFVGEKGAAAMDAVEEASVRLDNLAVAREMEDAGKTPKAIKLATGWERGADRMWRYEVPDIEINQDTKLVEDGEDVSTTLGSLVESSDLFAAYPELRDVEVTFTELPMGHNGSYLREVDGGKPEITLSSNFIEEYENPAWADEMRRLRFNPLVREWYKAAEAEPFNADNFDKAERALRRNPIGDQFYVLQKGTGEIPRYLKKITGEGTLAHEIQHIIQEKEGFAQGGTTTGLNTRLSERLNQLTDQINQLRAEGRDAEADEIIKNNRGLAEAVINNDADVLGNYKKLAGEVEARNVAARLNMTPEQRRETLAAETADVAPEDQIFLYNSIESSELADENASPKAPRRSKVEKLQDKITALRNELHDNKKSLKDVLYRVYEFLTSADVLNAMETGVGKTQYRSVLKAITTAIEQSYGKKDMDVVRQIVDKYLWQAEDIMARVLAHRRLNEITQILNTTVEGYTPQGVRVGKRIDEKTRNTFKTIRDAIAESFVEQTEETDNGARRKPVKYRLRNRTEDGDIATSYRLQTTGRIANITQQADDIIADNADNTSATAIQVSANLVYIANVLTSYDATLELNEQIGTVSEEIDELETKIQQATAAHRAAAPGSAEKVQLWNDLKAFRYAKEAAIQNRANLRKSYAARLKTFTETLKELVELGVANLKNAEVDKIEKEIAWKVGIYRSVKDPSAKVLPNRDYTEKGKKKSRRSAKAIKRSMLNENQFMATFAELSKEIDIASIPGQWLEDGWYYQFMLSPEGYMFRADWRHNEEQRIQKLMEDKTKEIFERSSLWSKIKAQSFNLLNIVAYEAQKESGFKISELAIKTDKDGKIVGGVQRSVPLTIGNLLYIRNIVRQQGGKAGYVTWGISEELLDQMVAYVEQKYPEYCQFSDWVVRELIPQLYEQQDAIYFERFGTHLTKTHDYFPIVRDKRFVGKIAEVGEGEVSMPSSVTGNIVERVKTSAKMDLTADMFTVLRNHIKETLDWIAYSELTRKFNSMSTSHAFRNMMEAQDFSVDKLKEMYEIAIGQGKINKTDNTALTKTLNTISKNLVAANLVFNFNAAAKQLISMTAILGYTAEPKFVPIWAKNYFVPSVAKLGVQKIIKMIKEGTLNPAEALDAKAFFDNWRWALENIPTLRARWESRHAGFEVFKAEGVARWEKLTSWISTVGLMPNAFVDMLTCANGARAVYEYQYAENIARGLSKEDAHRDACVKAAVMVNETQQSGLDAFISKFQAGGGMARLLGVGLGAYQNTAMSFARNEHYSFAQVIRMLRKKNRERMIDFKVQEYQSKGKSREEAEKLATKEFKLAFWSQVNSVLHNSIFSNFAWTLGGMLSTMFAVAFGSMDWDDDKWFWESESWEKFWHNEDVRRQFAGIFSLGTILWQFPLVYNHPISKQVLVALQALRKGSNYGSTFESPVVSEIDDLLESISKQWSGVVDPITGEVKKYETIRTEQTVEHIVWAFLLKTGLTLNKRVIKNISDGIKGMIEDGVDVEDIMNFLSSPRSLTRSIAGEPRKGETTEQYLDRMSYVYRLINEGSGIYDSKWQRERIDEYVRKRERPLYEAMGIDPLDAQALEAHKKAIEKILLLRRAGNLSKVKEGKADEFVGLSPKAKDVHIEMYRLKRLIDAKELQLKYMVEFDDERAALLKEKYKLEQDLYNKWKEYIKL